MLSHLGRRALRASRFARPTQSCAYGPSANVIQFIAIDSSEVRQRSVNHHWCQARYLHKQQQFRTQAPDITQAAYIGTKVCSACKQDKPYTAYSKRAASYDSLQFRCKVCQKAERDQLRHDRRFWEPYNGLMQCAVCERVKDAKEFYKRIGTIQGAQYECQTCSSMRLATLYQQGKAANRQPSVESKVCRNCQAEKPAEAFYRNVGRKDCLQSHCKQCTHAYQRHNLQPKSTIHL